MILYTLNIDMPKNCDNCPLCSECLEAHFNRDKVSDSCRLIEIPDDSKLIDADALMKDINDSIDAMTNIGIMVDGEWLWEKLNNAIDSAPTIIEVED